MVSVLVLSDVLSLLSISSQCNMVAGQCIAGLQAPSSALQCLTMGILPDLAEAALQAAACNLMNGAHSEQPDAAFGQLTMHQIPISIPNAAIK